MSVIINREKPKPKSQFTGSAVPGPIESPTGEVGLHGVGSNVTVNKKFPKPEPADSPNENSGLHVVSGD